MTAELGSDPDAELLLHAARRWIESDPDEQTRRELEALVERRSLADIHERVAVPIRFGTAGLRGIVGAGPARMNRAVVIRTTRALADYLSRHIPDARSLPVIVGFDARLSSERLAADAIGVLSAAGLSVRYFREPVPTPLVAYAQRELSGCAAIVLTASHNPPEYNGYKLYGPDGLQIAPPWDIWIEERVEGVGPANRIPRDEAALERSDDRVAPVPEALGERYVHAILALKPAGRADRTLKLVYSPLHGVGGAWFHRVFRTAGFENLHDVPEQSRPDGRFPTVRFPNPEEPGALDRAIERAQACRADLVLVNDPDADRLAVAVPTAAGRWIRLTGDQVGLLLAEQALEQALKWPRPLIVSTIVSSPLLERLAEAYGARFEQTLTGFKWIWRAALELERTEHVRFAFGYEEALGYSAPNGVRDKDGICAAYLVAELAAHLRAAGRSLLEQLASIYRHHGFSASVQRSIVRPGLVGAEEIRAALDRAVAVPPVELGGCVVTGVTDYRAGAETRPPWLPNEPVIRFDLAGGGRALLRPSGTEPKLKLYAHVPEPLGPGKSLQQAERQAVSRGSRVLDELVDAMGLA